MIKEFDIVNENNHEKLHDLETELDDINANLDIYREKAIKSKLALYIDSENVEKYYNDELEIDYSSLKNDYSIKDEEIVGIKESLVKFYDEQQISINVYETTYTADESLAKEGEDYFNDYFNEMGFESIHVPYTVPTGSIGVGIDYYNYAEQVEYAIKEVKEHLENNTDDAIDIDFEINKVFNSDDNIEKTIKDVSDKIKEHNTTLSDKQRTNMSAMLKKISDERKRIIKNTGRIVKIEKNNFEGDSLISAAYVSEEYFKEENKVALKVLELALGAASGKIGEKAVEKAMGKMVDISVSKAEEAELGEKIFKIGENINKNLVKFGINEFNNKTLSEIFKKHSEIIKEPLKEFSDSFNERNNLDGLTESQIKGLSNVDKYANLAIDIGSMFTLLNPYSGAAAVLGAVVSVSVELYKGNLSKNEGIDLYSDIQEGTFDFDNRFSKGNLIKELPERVDVKLNEGYNNIVADGTKTNKVEGNNDNNNIEILLGNNNKVFGKDGDDVIIGSEERDFIVGGFGSDKIYGNKGNDILIGSGANIEWDISKIKLSEKIDSIDLSNISGGIESQGDDEYVFKEGDGKDIIYDYQIRNNFFVENLLNSGKDKLTIKGYKKENSYTFKEGDDLVIALLDNSQINESKKYSDLEKYIKNGDEIDTITIKKGFRFNSIIEEIIFEDADEKATLQELYSYESPKYKKEYINKIYSSEKDEILKGTEGKDKYYFSSGDGNDEIIEKGIKQDTIIFEDIESVEDIELIKTDNDLVLNYGENDSVKIQGYFSELSKQVELIEIGEEIIGLEQLVNKRIEKISDKQNSTEEYSGFYIFKSGKEPARLEYETSSVEYNGEKLEFYYTPYKKDGKTMVSIREFVQSLDASISLSWNESEKKTTFTYNGKTLWIDYDDSKYYVNGEVKEMFTSPDIIADNIEEKRPTMMVDSEVIAELFEFDYNKNTNFISMESSEVEAIEIYDPVEGDYEEKEGSIGNIKVKINGKKVKINNLAYLDDNTWRTMVDIKDFIVKLNKMSPKNYSYYMPSQDRIIIENEEGKKSIAEAGSNEYTIDGSTRYNEEDLDVRSVIKNEKLMVPIRFVSEMLDADVKWNGSTYTVDLYTNELDVFGSGIERVAYYNSSYSQLENTIYGSSSNDSLNGTTKNDYIKGRQGNDKISSGSGDDKLKGDSGNDRLSGGSGNDRLSGGSGDDELSGGRGDDRLDGGFGNDELSAGTGDDILIGGKGNDILDGSYGSDRYIFEGDFGKDVIRDYRSRRSSSVDTIEFTDVSSNEVEYYKDPMKQNDLVIKVKNSDNEVRIEDYFSSTWHQMEEIKFSDKTITRDYMKENIEIQLIGNELVDEYNGARHYKNRMVGNKNDDQITGGYKSDKLFGEEGNDILRGKNGNDELSGGLGDDTLEAGTGDDILIGGKGNDILDGSYGSDRYIFEGDFGKDVIRDYRSRRSSSVDTIEFTDVSSNEVEYYKDPMKQNDLVIKVKNSDNEVRIEDYFSSTWHQMEEIKFSDKTITRDYMKENIEIQLIGNELVDEYNGARHYKNRMVGNKNDDQITGGYKSDKLFGEEGNDILRGKNGNDELSGGLGDDTLEAGTGDDILIGGKGNDILDGSYGSDRYIFEGDFGKDVIRDYRSRRSSSVDTIEFTDVSSNEVEYYKDPMKQNDLVIKVKNSDNEVRIEDYFSSTWHQMEEIKFSDKTITRDYMKENIEIQLIGNELVDEYNGARHYKNRMVGNKNDDQITGGYKSDKLFGEEGNDILRGKNGNDELSGGLGDDTLEAGTGDDILIGGKGNDILDGSYGSDRYIFEGDFGKDVIRDYRSRRSSSVDTIEFTDVSSNEVEYYKDPMKQNDLVIKVKNSDNEVRIEDYFSSTWHQMEEIKFSDKTITRDYMKENIEIQLIGNELVDEYNGARHYKNRMVGNKNDDQITGGYKSDKLFGEEGNDILRGKNGNDELSGGLGDDTLEAGTGDDILIGGKGNDILDGSYGSDRYIFEGDFGKDVIRDYRSRRSSSVDTIEFTDVSSNEVEYHKDPMNQNDLVIKVKDSDNEVRIEDYFSSTWHQMEEIKFSDKTITRDYMKENIEIQLIGNEIVDEYNGARHYKNRMVGNKNDDQITGGYKSDKLFGEEGNDILRGKNGNDELSGGLGDDTLEAGTGDDILIGGKGNDILDGSYGSDRYIFEGDFGKDVIIDDRSDSGSDAIYLNDREASDIQISIDKNDPNDLLIDIIDSNNQIKVDSWFNSSIENIYFSDDQKITSNKINLLIENMAAFTEENNISWEEVVEDENETSLDIIAINQPTLL